MVSTPPYLVRLQLKEGAADGREYPFNLPLIRCLDIEFSSPVTFFVGENGTGKSTVIEAIAALCKLPVSGGGRNELAGHHGPDATSPLAKSLRPSFRRRPPDAYFSEPSSRPTSRRCSMRATPTRTSGWGRFVRALRGTVAAYPVPWRSLSGDSPEPDSVRAPAVRRAGVRALTSASTGAPGSHVRARGGRHVAVHHRDAFADSVDVSRRADSLVRRRLSASRVP